MYKRLVFENLLFVVIRSFASTLKVSLTGYIIKHHKQLVFCSVNTQSHFDIQLQLRLINALFYICCHG